MVATMSLLVAGTWTETFVPGETTSKSISGASPMMRTVRRSTIETSDTPGRTNEDGIDVRRDELGADLRLHPGLDRRHVGARRAIRRGLGLDDGHELRARRQRGRAHLRVGVDDHEGACREEPGDTQPDRDRNDRTARRMLSRGRAL